MITFDQTDKLDVLPDQLNNRPSGSILENLTAAYDSGKYSGGAGANSDFMTAQEIWGPILDELKTNGLDVEDPTMFLYTSFLSGDFANHSAYRKTATDIFAKIQENKDTLPSELQNLTLDTINERMKAFAINKQQELQDLADVSPGFDKTVARFFGSIGVGAFDPMTAVTAPFGGWSKTLWKNLLQNAAVNAGAGAISEVAVAEWYKEIGLEYTYEDFLTNVAMQGAFGAALPVAGRGVKITYAQMKKGWKVLSESGGNKPPAMEQALADALDEQETLILENPLEGPMVAQNQKVVAGIENARSALGVEFDATVPILKEVQNKIDSLTNDLSVALDAGDTIKLESVKQQIIANKELRTKIETRRAEIGDELVKLKETEASLPPPAKRNDIAELEHENRAATAQTAVDNGQLPSMPDMPESPVSPTTLLDAVDNLDGVLFKFDPRDIQVDAKTFQFKAGGDEFGVGERLQGAVWDDSKSGRISVYEYADGSRFIIDGHQRLGLAKRSLSQNPNQKITLYGDLIKEVDGVSVDQARVRAAMKNIAEGSGTAIDAAKVLRVEPSRLSELPPKSDLVRQAQDMMDMPEAAFMAIINRVIPENYGAIVGRVLKDMPELQEAAIAILAKAGPANVFQAEAIVRQVRSAGGEEIKQIDLFGETAFVESFYNERSKVLDETYKQLRKDKAAFENLTRNADRLEAEGNQLAREANEKRATTDAQTISLLQAVANRKGGLSDALTNAAKSARSTGNYAAASREFLTDVRRAIESGDFDRVSNGDVGRPLDGAPSTRPNTPEAEPSLEGFDEATGPAAEAQADQLIQDLLGAPEPVRVAPEVGSLDELKDLIKSNATRAEIDNHPAFLDAMEKLDSIPETQTIEGFGTEQWHTDRVYTVDGQRIVGTENALTAWEKQAEELAWTEKNITPQPVGRNREVTIILGPPASGKSTIANDLAIARKAAILDSDEIKKSIPEFGNGIGANATHEESSILAKILAHHVMDRGTNVILPKVGDSVSSIQKQIDLYKSNGYTVSLVNMAVTPENAYKRMVGRFAASNRVIPPAYLDYVGTKPTETYATLKQENAADGYAEIDNNGGYGDPKPVTDIFGENPLRESVFDPNTGGGAVIGIDAGRADVAQQSQAAAQDITLPENIFDDMDMEIPIGETIDPVTNERVASTITMRDLKTQIDMEDSLIQRLGFCTT